MHGGSQQFFAGAAFAQQQNRHVGLGDAFDRAADFQHLRACGDQPVDRRALIAFLQTPVFFFQRVQPQRAVEDRLQHVDIDRLLVEIVGPGRDRFQRVVAGFVAVATMTLVPGS